MTLYNPGPDGNAGDTWNEHELGVDAPKHRLGQDTKDLGYLD